MKRIALAVVALLLLAPAAAAGAQEAAVSREEFRNLAERAVDDPTARARLNQVTSVEGQAVDVPAALAGADGAALADRLRALAGETGGVVPPGADDARAEALRVLEQEKFQPSRIPRPLHGVMRWIGDRVEPVTGPISRLWGRVIDTVAGQVVVVALVLGLATLVATVVVRRRSNAGVLRARRRRDEARSDDPDELERLAAAAEERGDFGTAVRLRFRAGLLRLDAVGALHYEPSLTTRAAARLVDSEELADLGRAFDEIVYGGRRADREDATRAKDGWQRTLADVGAPR